MCHNPQTRLSAPDKLSWIICRSKTIHGSRPTLAFASIVVNNKRKIGPQKPIYSWTISSVSLGPVPGRVTTNLKTPLIVTSVDAFNTTDRRKQNITLAASQMSRSLPILSAFSSSPSSFSSLPSSSVSFTPSSSSSTALLPSSSPSTSVSSSTVLPTSNHILNTGFTSQTQPHSTATTHSSTLNRSSAPSVSFSSSFLPAYNSSASSSSSAIQVVRTNSLENVQSYPGFVRILSVASNPSLNSHRSLTKSPRLIKNKLPPTQMSGFQSTLRPSRQTQRTEWPQFASNIFNQFFTTSVQVPNMISSAFSSWFH